MPKQFKLFTSTNLADKCRMKLVSPITNSSKRCKTVQHVGYINFVEHCAVCKWQLRNFGHAQKGKFSRVLKTDTAAPWLFYLLLFLPARLPPPLFSFAKFLWKPLGLRKYFEWNWSGGREMEQDFHWKINFMLTAICFSVNVANWYFRETHYLK